MVSGSSRSVKSSSSVVTADRVVSGKNTPDYNLGLEGPDAGLSLLPYPHKVTSKDNRSGTHVTHLSVLVEQAVNPCHPPGSGRNSIQHSLGSVRSSPWPNTTASPCSYPKSGTASKHKRASDCCVPLVDFQNTEVDASVNSVQLLSFKKIC